MTVFRKSLFSAGVLLILMAANLVPQVQGVAASAWDALIRSVVPWMTFTNGLLLVLASLPWLVDLSRHIPLRAAKDWLVSQPEVALARTFVSVSGLVLLGVYLIRTGFTVDANAIILLAVAVLPWLASLIRSAKLPGGLEITFKDIARAQQLVDEAGGTPARSRRDRDIFDAWHSIDRNLAVVALRIEIEKRIRAFAALTGRPPSRPLSMLIREMAQARDLPRDLADGLLELVSVGNAAAHGAEVSTTVNEWAYTYGAQVIQRLEVLRRKR